MEQRNVAVIEGLFDAFTRRDARPFTEAYDSEVVWDTSALDSGGELQGVFHGIDGVRDWWRDWLSAWDEIDVIAVDHEERGDNVVSTWRQVVRGRGSGLEMEMEVGIVWTFRDGRIIRATVFPTRAAARARG